MISGPLHFTLQDDGLDGTVDRVKWGLLISTKYLLSKSGARQSQTWLT